MTLISDLVENKWSRKNPLISFVLDSDWCWVLKQWDVNWKYKSLNKFSGFFHFHSYLPYFLNIVLLNQDEFFEIYLLLLTAEDDWWFHTWSGAISWIRPLSLLDRTYSPGCRIGGSFLISVSVKKRPLVLCVTLKGYLSVTNIQISPVPWVNASKSIQSCVLQQ